MKAVVKMHDGVGGWVVKEMTREDPGPKDVEIQIKAIGICGSELHLYHDNHFYTPGTIVGHEFSGVISRVGSEVTEWRVGDRVISENHRTACGECEYCKTGHPMFCKDRKSMGYATNGGWAEYTLMPARLLLKIPDNVTYEEASMTEPCTIVINALCFRAPVQAGGTILVQGAGTIGMLAAMVAKAAGAGKVILTGTEIDREVRLPIARKLKQIDEIIDVSSSDLYQEIMARTDGNGVDMVVEASGAVTAINEAIRLVKKTGRIVAIGEAASEKIEFTWNAAIFRACDITFTYGAEYESWKLALQFMSDGMIDLQPMITHRLLLSEFHEGFKLLETKKGIKVILYPED